MKELERLEAELRARQAEVSEYRHHVIEVWYGQGDAIGSADTPLTPQWRDRYHELKAEADEAEDALLDYLGQRGPR